MTLGLYNRNAVDGARWIPMPIKGHRFGVRNQVLRNDLIRGARTSPSLDATLYSVF
jgi:hypothetical protein